MEPLMPSEIARLVYGYLKKESNEDTAAFFLKTSPHLSECYQMFKANRNFNIKVNGFHLHDIFDIFGTMCSMINGRISETCETKSLIEKLQYLLDVNHKPINEDKCVETESNMVDKCISCNSSEKITTNVSKTKEIDSINEISKTVENPCLSSSSKVLIHYNGNIPSFSKFEEKESSVCQINDQISSNPTKKVEDIRTSVEPVQYFSPKNNHHQLSLNQSEYQQIPEATSLESLPELSKEDRIKDSLGIIDNGDLIHTLLSDQSLLKKFDETANKSIEIQKETSNIQEGQVLDPPLEKAIYSTQSDPQIKKKLCEFLVFNDVDDGKMLCSDAQSLIKSSLRSTKYDVTGKRKNNLSIQKHANFSNEEYVNVDSNIVLINNIFGSTIFGNCNFDKTQTLQGPEKSIFPKKKRRSLQVPSIRSNFRKSNFLKNSVPPTTSISIQSPQKNIIEVPNQSSLDIQAKNNKIIKLTEVSKVNVTQDTPDDTVKPPKNRSMSTPRRRSTHIRCLNFSTPQPKSTARDQARSKLFFDSPKRCEKFLEEPSSSFLPKLQADWGINEYESIVKKDNAKHWDTDLIDIVGAGILTSDADGRKSRNKKTPRKNIKLASDQSNSELINEEKDNSIKTNESTTDETNQTNISEEICNLNNENSSKPLLDDQKSLKEQSEKVREVSNKPLPIESNLHKNTYKTQSNLEKFITNIKEQENKSNTVKVRNHQSTISKTLPEIIQKCDEKNSIICNYSKPLTYKLPENKKTEPIEKFDKHASSNQIKKNNSSELNSPNKFTAIQPAKQNQPETPYKCDDSAVDVPEISISKLMLEYDPSMLVTSLPCTLEHYADSLTVKVFKETSNFNRPLISQFPSTPGNLMPVDTSIVPLEQENSKMSDSTISKKSGQKKFSTRPFQSTTIITESSAIKKKINVKSTPLRVKPKVSTKKNGFKGKNSLSAKKVYESVKAELFGNIITSSSSEDELENSNEHNNIVIIKKPPENKKKTGFKSIPKRKSIQSLCVPVNDTQNYSLVESNIKVNKLSLIKPTVVQNDKIAVENTKKTSNIKKSKKSMIYFDDPIQEVKNTPAKKIPYKTNYKNEIKNKTFSHNSSMKNTSCVNVGHDDELETNLKKDNDRLKNIEYLKKPKVYEVITDDGEHQMVCLELSETFVFLNIPSEVNNVSQSNSISSPLKVREQLDVIPDLETGELESYDDIPKPVTSTPKDIEKQDDQKQMRSRRSPSFWEDSLHNYPSKHIDGRHMESNRYSNNFRDNKNNKNRSLIRYHDNHGYSRFQRTQGNIKREFSDDHFVRDNERSKYRDDKIRNYLDFSSYDDRKARDQLEEPERFSSTQRKLQNEKLNRIEDIVKNSTKRPLNQDDYKIPPKVSTAKHQQLLKNLDVDKFLCVVHKQNYN